MLFSVAIVRLVFILVVVQDIMSSEFAFVGGLPKREKAKVRTAVDVLNEWREATKLHGSLVPRPLVARVLNVSQERVRQFIDEGRLQTVRVEGHDYVTEGSLVVLAKAERKHGRPFKVASEVQKSAAVADYLEAAAK